MDKQGVSSENKVSISVVIPYHNDAERIHHCIDSVNRSAAVPDHYSCDIEIVVVDDNSPEPIPPVNSVIPITYIRHAENRGAGASRNTGAIKAKGDYILFLDSDVVLDDSHIPVLCSVIQSEQVTILQGPTAHIPANNNKGLFQRYLAGAWFYYGKTNGTIALFTQCTLIRKSFFMETGGFSEHYGKSGGEEFDFARRLSFMKTPVIMYDDRLIHYHHFDGMIKRLYKVVMRSRHILSIVTDMPALPFRFRAESMMRSSFAVLMNCCLLSAVVSPATGVPAYLAAGVLWFYTDWRFSNHMLRYQSQAIAVLSVVFRQMEYTAIHIGIALGILRRIF